MLTLLIQWFQGLSPQVATLLLAMVPITELRAALPVALGVYHLSWQSAAFWSVIGNLIPVPIVYFFLSGCSAFLGRHSRAASRFFTWLFERSRHKAVRQYERYGLIGLAIFVAIPLPGTGAWTGIIAAWVFGVSFRRAAVAVTLGVLGAAVIVTLVSIGAFHSWRVLL